jgi:hypothetical protein
MPLTCPQVAAITNQAWFVFDINPRQTDTACLGVSGFFGGGNLFSGEGAVDLERIQVFLLQFPRNSILLDVSAANNPGFGGIEPGTFRPVNIADVVRLMTQFVWKYGYVKKPNAFAIYDAPPPYKGDNADWLLTDDGVPLACDCLQPGGGLILGTGDCRGPLRPAPPCPGGACYPQPPQPLCNF